MCRGRPSGTSTAAQTRLDWNDDALHDRVLVTIRCSQKLARTIVNVSGLPENHYPFRMFMQFEPGCSRACGSKRPHDAAAGSNAHLIALSNGDCVS